MLAAAGAPAQAMQVVPGGPAWFHPGRSGTIQIGPQNVLGHFGELHPRALEALDAEGPLVAFEVILEKIPEGKAKATRAKPALELSAFQPVTRDFAFVVDRAVKAADIVRAAQNVDRKLITGVGVFDVYEGPGIDAGKKSVAIAVTIQPREKTMTEPEIDALAAKIVAEVGKRTAACCGLAPTWPPRIAAASPARPGNPASYRNDGRLGQALGHELIAPACVTSPRFARIANNSGSGVMDMSVPAGGNATTVEQPNQADERRNASELDVWLEKAEAMGELKRITAEVSPDLEAAHITYLVGLEKSPALLFENIKGHPGHKALYNMIGCNLSAVLPDDRRGAGRSSAQGGASCCSRSSGAR